jgi:hypothetical protein
MPQCFRCGNAIQSTDVKCKTCRAELKAFGHAGIELHRATGDAPLCDTCTYHADNSCDYDKRPFAQDCTLYRNINQKIAAIHRPGARKPRGPIFGPTKDYPRAPAPFTPEWWQDQQSVLAIGAVIFVILLLAIVMR